MEAKRLCVRGDVLKIGEGAQATVRSFIDSVGRLLVRKEYKEVNTRVTKEALSLQRLIHPNILKLYNLNNNSIETELARESLHNYLILHVNP
jgi:hypothetical protein